MFGSDWPHSEGVAEPERYWPHAEVMDTRRTYGFMGDNTRRFMDLSIANPDPAAVTPPRVRQRLKAPRALLLRVGLGRQPGGLADEREHVSHRIVTSWSSAKITSSARTEMLSRSSNP